MISKQTIISILFCLLFIATVIITILVLTGQIEDGVMYAMMTILSVFMMFQNWYVCVFERNKISKFSLVLAVIFFAASIPMLGFSIDKLSKAYPSVY